MSKGHTVALVLERGISLVVAELATLKAGAAYVPIDPQTPTSRQAWIIADCAAHLALVDPASLDTSLGSTYATTVDALLVESFPTTSPLLDWDSENVAYVMYTSD